MLKEGGAAAGRRSPGADLEGLALGVTRVTVMHMGINAAGHNILAGCIDGTLRLGQAAGCAYQRKLSVLNTYIRLAEAAFNKNKTVYYCQI